VQLQVPLNVWSEGTHARRAGEEGGEKLLRIECHLQQREDCEDGQAREGGGKEACAKEGSGTSSCVRFGHFSFCFEALLLPFCRWRCALGSSSRCWQLGMRFNTVAQHSQVLRLLYKRMPFDLAHVIEIEEEQKLLDSV